MASRDRELRDEVKSLRAEVRRLRAELRRLTPPLSVLLRRRGFSIHRQEPEDDLLLPPRLSRTKFYEQMHRYSFRLFLRDVIRHQDGFTVADVTRYASPDVTKSYVATLIGMRLLRREGRSYRLAKRPIRSFGVTLEWYLAEVLRREFGAEALWGVTFRKRPVGGDYDVLAKVDGALLYVEVKSSPPKQIYDSEIAAFLNRVDDLAPEIALFLMDTELRMKDKIVPMFEKELARRFIAPPEVRRLERELFEISERIFIANAQDGIVANVGTVLGRWYRTARAARPEGTSGRGSEGGGGPSPRAESDVRGSGDQSPAQGAYPLLRKE